MGIYSSSKDKEKAIVLPLLPTIYKMYQWYFAYRAETTLFLMKINVILSEKMKEINNSYCCFIFDIYSCIYHFSNIFYVGVY